MQRMLANPELLAKVQDPKVMQHTALNLAEQGVGRCWRLLHLTVVFDWL